MAVPSLGSGRFVLRTDVPFNGVKVFSATMFQRREQLGEVITEWIAGNPAKHVTEFVVTQSSDAEFHCVAVSVFYAE
ncbi:MAG TPA: hypothetical protein VGG28_14470 [Kofleriaceae bacterium]|jgi:hypothetical protein